VGKGFAKALATTVLAGAVILPLALNGCGQADWMDLVVLNDITYYSDFQPDPVDETGLSPYGKTRHKLDGNVSCQSYQLKNGDAAFLEPGTTVYAMSGYAPTFRLAARRDGKWFIYEGADPKARKGGDLFDIGGKVEYIGINSHVDGAEMASIKDPAVVNELVGMILEAPVDHGAARSGSEQYFLEFHLKDGTSSNGNYWLDLNLLGQIQLPEEFGAAIRAALGDQSK